MAFIDQVTIDIRHTLYFKLLEGLPPFLQEKFHIDEYKLEEALKEFLNGSHKIHYSFTKPILRKGKEGRISTR